MDQKILMVIDYPLKRAFDAAVASFSNNALPDWLKDFEAFKKLKTNSVIQTSYDVAMNATNPNTCENLYNLIIEVLKADCEISPDSAEKLKALKKKIQQLKGERPSLLQIFIEESDEHLIIFNSLNDTSSLEEVKKKMKEFFTIIEKASDLYYQERKSLEKKKLQTYGLSISLCLLKNIARLMRVIIKNYNLKDYPLSRDDLLKFLEKALTVKGVTMLFGEKFWSELKTKKDVLLKILKADQFLLQDFSKKITKEQEILDVIPIFSEFYDDEDISNWRRLEIFRYYYQFESIVEGNAGSKGFIEKITLFIESFKQSCPSSMSMDLVKVEEANNEQILHCALTTILLDSTTFDAYDRNSKFQFQIKVKKAHGQYQTDWSAYSCFHIEALNYITFFQEKELHVRVEEVKKLSMKLMDMQNINDPYGKYVTQKGVKKLLGYFAKNLIIAMLPPTNVQSIALPLLLKEAQKRHLYLTEVKKFYDTLLGVIRRFSPKFCADAVMINFIDALDLQKNIAEQQCISLEATLQKQEKLKLFIDEKISMVVSYAQLAEQKFDEIKRLWTKKVAEKIQETITHFRFDVCYPIYITNGKKIEKKYCFATQYDELKKLVGSFLSVKNLETPESCHNMLKEAFTSEELPSNEVFIFIMGHLYQEKGDAVNAKKCYEYCLSNKLWEDPQINKELTVYIRKEVIEKRKQRCEQILRSKETVVAAVPSVFEQPMKSSSNTTHSNQINSSPSLNST